MAKCVATLYADIQCVDRDIEHTTVSFAECYAMSHSLLTNRYLNKLNVIRFRLANGSK